MCTSKIALNYVKKTLKYGAHFVKLKGLDWVEDLVLTAYITRPPIDCLLRLKSMWGKRSISLIQSVNGSLKYIYTATPEKFYFHVTITNNTPYSRYSVWTKSVTDMFTLLGPMIYVNKTALTLGS